MKVFISWSGEPSKQIATVLQHWLRVTLQASEPWISADIAKGARWSEQLSVELEEARVGIFCLTPDNLDSRWLLFEAGALSKRRDARACTFLVDVERAAVEPPLAQFQHTSFNKHDVYELLKTINEEVERAGEKALEEGILQKVFERTWPDLEQGVNEISSTSLLKTPNERPADEILRELLDLSRAQASQLDSIATLIAARNVLATLSAPAESGMAGPTPGLADLIGLRNIGLRGVYLPPGSSPKLSDVLGIDNPSEGVPEASAAKAAIKRPKEN